MAVQRDSRTFRQAASVRRLGFESVVVEGETSHLDRNGLPFRLATEAVRLEQAGTAAAEGARARRRTPGRLSSFVKRLAEPLLFIPWYLVAYGPRTARRLPSASLYYLHSFRQFPGVWLRARRTGTPVVYDAHDFYPVSQHVGEPRTRRERVVDRFLLMVERACVKRAAAVVTVSEGVAGEMEREFGRRPVIVRNCHDRRIDTQPRVGLREATGLTGDDVVICTVGNAKEGGATSEAIAAMALLPDHVHLVLVGSGYERYASDIRRAGVTGRVHLLPPVKPTEVVPFMSSADIAAVLYHPLTADYLHALPNRFFSAVAAGLPLLYPAELLELAALAAEHDLGVAIDPREPGSIAMGVQTLLENPDRLLRHRAASQRAREVLSWELEERRLEAVVEEALSRVQ